MDAKYDAFFAALPKIQFKECLRVQSVENERPFLPQASSALQSSHRTPTDHYVTPKHNGTLVKGNAHHQGTAAQRHTTIEEMEKTARKLTPQELGTA